MDRSGVDLVHEISSKYDRNRTDYIDHATDFADIAEELWNERNLNKSVGRQSRDGSVVNAVEPRRSDRRICHNCQKKSKPSVCMPRNEGKEFRFREEGKETRHKKEDFALSVSYQDEDKATDQPHGVWPRGIKCILYSGCGRHLTGSPDLLGEDTDKAGASLVLPDGTRTRSLRKGKIEMVTLVGHETCHLVVQDVEYVPGFKRNLLSYVSLDKKGVRLCYEEEDTGYLVSKLGTVEYGKMHDLQLPPTNVFRGGGCG